MKTFLLEKFTQAIEFHCRNCGKDKKSKNIARNVEDDQDKLCNSCFGLLLSKDLISKSSSLKCKGAL